LRPRTLDRVAAVLLVAVGISLFALPFLLG
jgi:hypothetical protein